jgi:superfamily II DNA or RNA helicase
LRKLAFAGGTLLLDRMTAAAMARLFGPIPWTWDARTRAWRTDAIHYAAVREALDAGRWQVVDQVAGWKPVRWSPKQACTLRPDQQQAAAAWRASQRGVIVMPTGTGKTEVGLAIMRAEAVSTLVVAPVRDLMYQWHRRIQDALGYDAGIIGDSLFRVRPVAVTTYDSACIHMERLGNQFGLIVFDECHHLPGPVRRDAARMSAAPMRLGLTATPLRCDGRHTDLDWLIGPTVYEMPMAAARGEVLADYDVIRIPIHLSPAEQARYDRLTRQVRSYVAALRRSGAANTWKDVCAAAAGDPAARRALAAYRASRSMEDRAGEKLRVLEDLFRLHYGSRMIVFAGSNAMARDVSRRFLIPCLLNHCRKDERQEILRGLEEGRYPAVVANRVLDEGVDLPEAKVAVVIGGLSSTRQAIQRLGRILRRSGEARAVLYEVVCAETNDERVSRRRRKSDAYQGTRHSNV